MNNDIYEWLNNNNNEQPPNNNHNDDTSLIECTLILSINGIIISKDSLINYCNIVYNNNKSIINNNREKEDVFYEITSSSTSFYGLSIKQFQTIYNINSLNNSTTTTTTTPLPTSSTNDTEDIISNKIKFKSSIKIITENNKRIFKQQQQRQQKHNNNNNNNNNMVSSIPNNNIKYIKSCECNGNKSMDIIFYLAWRNMVIRNEILFHTRLYNSHYNKEIELTCDQLSNYKYRNYLDKIKLFDSNDSESFRQPTDIPWTKLYNIKLGLIPYGVSYIKFDLNSILQDNSIPNSVTSVSFCRYLKQIFTKDLIPDSITSLAFDSGTYTNQLISKTWLPKSLLSLSFGRWFQNYIDLNELPESLTELNFHKEYDGKITSRSTPSSSIIKSSCNFKFNSRNDQLTSIPKSTTYLEFDQIFNQTIKKGDIPHNVTSIKFNKGSNAKFESKSLPKSLTSLDLGTSEYIINGNILPPNLTYVALRVYDEPLSPNLFPQSITSIKITSFSQQIPIGYFYSFANLKSLVLNCHFDDVIPGKILPPSLTSLDLGKFYKLDANVLPDSLSNLCIGELNIKSPGKLPPSITSLTVYSNYPIPAGILPCNLKELYINNKSFNQHLSFDSFEQGILPRSLQSIYIESRNLNLINSLDPHFFNKYIRPLLID